MLAGTAACGSAPKVVTAPSPTSPFLSAPPAEVGNGLVCAAAADRLLGIADGLDMHQFTHGPGRPRSPAIQASLAQYLTARSAATRTRAAGLIQGQCAAYGFYVTTYQQCVRASKATSVGEAVRTCVARRTWTVYSQQ